MRTPRIRCGPSARTRQKQRALLNAGGLGREDQINYTSRAVVQVCESVQPRLAVSRYVEIVDLLSHAKERLPSSVAGQEVLAVGALASDRFEALVAFPREENRPKGGSTFMVNTVLRSKVIAAWAAAVAIIAALSVAMNASLSTTALVVAIGLSPAIMVIVLSNRAAAPTVAEILHSVHTEDGRP